jgi:formylglycine-generating enzyme required for sulfatase activity
VDSKPVLRPELNWRNPGFPQAGDHPVVDVTWNDAIDFCKWLSKKEGATYRLPTEAEWEFACRCGKHTAWATDGKGTGLDEIAWVAANSRAGTQPVATRSPNPFGLFDMFGNVWEWCADTYAADFYRTSDVDNPLNTAAGGERVLRGGSFFDPPLLVRAAFRFPRPPSTRVANFGFRVVCELNSR